MNTSIKRFGLCVAIAGLTIGSVDAQSPYGWRGPDRSGQYYESGLLKEWPAGGPQLLWETEELGHGYSSPVIVNDRLFITGMNEEKTQEVFCAFTWDGKMLYQTAYGLPWNDTYPETRTTPTIENGKAYMISGSGEVVCIDTADGKIVWKVDGGKDFQRKTGNWGTSECPLVFEGKVFYTPGGDQTTIVALDTETGKVVWKSEPLGEPSSYTSPILSYSIGIYKIITLTQKSVIQVDPETGKIEWTYRNWGTTPEIKARGIESIAPNTPLILEEGIFVCNGYDIGSFLLRQGYGSQTPKEVWRNNDLDTQHGGFVHLDGIIYGSNWMGSSPGNWVAVDLKTGETKYNEAWKGGKSRGSIITADGMLYCYDERRGYVGLVRPTPEKFDVVSEFQIKKGIGPHWAHPVINNGVLYIRHGNALMAYKIK